MYAKWRRFFQKIETVNQADSKLYAIFDILRVSGLRTKEPNTLLDRRAAIGKKREFKKYSRRYCSQLGVHFERQQNKMHFMGNSLKKHMEELEAKKCC